MVLVTDLARVGSTADVAGEDVWSYNAYEFALRVEVNDRQTATPMADPEQRWFWTPAWQARERQADEDFAAGRSRVFESEEDFLSYLDGDDA
jgi:hypothetical protein